MEAAYSASGPAPGPQGHWLLGSIPAFKHDILRAVEEGRAAYGDLVRFKLGPKRSTSPARRSWPRKY